MANEVQLYHGRPQTQNRPSIVKLLESIGVSKEHFVADNFWYANRERLPEILKKANEAYKRRIRVAHPDVPSRYKSPVTAARLNGVWTQIKNTFKKKIGLQRRCAECGDKFRARSEESLYCGQLCTTRMLARKNVQSAPLKKTRACAFCGDTFIIKHADSKFCGSECGYDSMRRAPKLCVQCGNPFTPRHSGKKCCSPECVQTWHRRPRKPPKPQIPCVFCERPFTPPKKDSKYCTQKCCGMARTGSIKEKICAWCSREFTPKTKKTKCCSKECTRRNNRMPKERHDTEQHV